MNAWALLYDELYGDGKMTDDNRVTPQESDEYDPKPESNTVTPQESDEYDPVITGADLQTDTPFNITLDDGCITGVSTASASSFFVDPMSYETVTIDTSNYPGVTVDDTVQFTMPDIPTPGIETDNPRKYKEDESIKALQDYISTTYGGHYTSKENNVQTLDLIESVGDAESFCRSNAIKYLSRYDKKGQAKRDILKALHYSLLLYHFSGQLNETPTRGYETF